MWITPIRSDIAYCAKELARHISSPKHCHWVHMKHVATYLYGSINEACVLKPVERICWTDTLIIRYFCDSDHAGNKLSPDLRSTSGMVISMHGLIIGSSSKTQPTMATSSGEAEILALSSALHECCAVRNILTNIGFRQKVSIHLMSDATTANRYSDRFGPGPTTRHIDIRYMSIQNLVAAGIVTVLRVEGKHKRLIC